MKKQNERDRNEFSDRSSKLEQHSECVEQQLADAQHQAQRQEHLKDELYNVMGMLKERNTYYKAKVKELQVVVTTMKQNVDVSAQGKKKRLFDGTSWNNGHEVMVRADGPTLVRCSKACGDVFTESFMRRHYVISKGGCQTKKRRGTESGM